MEWICVCVSALRSSIVSVYRLEASSLARSRAPVACRHCLLCQSACLCGAAPDNADGDNILKREEERGEEGERGVGQRFFDIQTCDLCSSRVRSRSLSRLDHRGRLHEFDPAGVEAQRSRPRPTSPCCLALCLAKGEADVQDRSSNPSTPHHPVDLSWPVTMKASTHTHTHTHKTPAHLAPQSALRSPTPSGERTRSSAFCAAASTFESSVGATDDGGLGLGPATAAAPASRCPKGGCGYKCLQQASRRRRRARPSIRSIVNRV